MTPRARQRGLLVQVVGDELVIYDQERHRLHVLNSTAALVWRHCTGQQTIAQLAARLSGHLDGTADEQLVGLALSRLRRAHLLEPAATPLPGVANRSRRRLLRQTAGAAAGALLLPTVTSIVAPTPAHAQSQPLPGPTSTPTQTAAGRTATPTQTAVGPTATPTETPTASPPTSTPTPTVTPSPTATITPTPTATPCPTGPTGVTGSSGPQGPQGPLGFQSLQVPFCPTGPTGMTGASGPQGPQGFQSLEFTFGLVGGFLGWAADRSGLGAGATVDRASRRAPEAAAPAPAAPFRAPSLGLADPSTGPLISVFTAAHDIGRDIDPAFRSLLHQTYPRWEWVVVDDSHHPETAAHVARLADSAGAEGRIRLHRQDPPPESIGATKAAAGALCRGEIVLELDHDDELLPEALEVVAATFRAHPDIDFVYSDWVDRLDEREGRGRAGLYPAGWGVGFGGYATEIVGGQRVPVALAPAITWETIRHIVSTPNHLRAWRTAFYRRIGGHDPRLAVADDYELLVRTFLDGTMARIPRPLYLQHHASSGTSASRRRNGEIQRLVEATAARSQTALDRRCRALGLAPSASAPWCSPAPMQVANARIDVVAEAAADRGSPLVSVVVPTYGRPELLRRALASVLSQTYAQLEVLVVGDHCPFVDEVVGSIDDPRLRHWNLDRHYGDLGATPRNYALKAMARGTLVAYLDDDNWWTPDHLESLVGLLVAEPTAAFAFGSFEVAGETIVCRRPRRFQIDTSALVHRSFLLERFGYWRAPSETDYAHDWELVSRWDGEPWLASLRPTLRYTLETSHQNLQTVRMLQAVADEERRAAVSLSPG